MGKIRKILTTDAEFPTVGQVWLAHEKWGTQVDYIPLSHGQIDLEEYRKRVDENTLLVSATHVYYQNGFKQDSQGFTFIDPQRNILITPGSDSGLFYAMFPFLEPGDEVLIPDPSYPNNTQNATLMGAVAVHVPLRPEDGYRLPVEEFRRLCTDRTKMVVLTNPNNPTSTVFSKAEISELCRLIVEKDLILVVDQAFEDILFDDHTMVHAALEEGMWERTVTVCSVSKGMRLSGYRVGCLVAHEGIMDRLYGAAVTVQGAANTLAQIAAQTAFQDDSFMESYRQSYDWRRYRSMMAVSKDTPLSRGTWSVTSPEVVVRFRS